MNLPRIVLFSNPLLATWVFDETRRILFDAGDGVTAHLDSKIHKIKVVALTHTHRDHCAGLMQLHNLRGAAGDLVTVFPEGSGSARALAGFLSAFDSRSSGRVEWRPLGDGESMPIEPDRHSLRAFETDHYPPPHPPRPRSLGYQIVRHVDKVRTGLRSLPQPELDALRATHGRDYIVETVEDVLLTITGDTRPLPPDTYRASRVLLHECTFLDQDPVSGEEGDGGHHPHTCLDEALEIARDADVGHLGLYHISRRYDDEFVLSRIRERCAQMQLAFPVSVALAGRVYHDFLAQTVWQGNRSAAPKRQCHVPTGDR